MPPRNSNHLRSESRAIIALARGRLDLENKFFPNKITLSPTYITFTNWASLRPAQVKKYLPFFFRRVYPQQFVVGMYRLIPLILTVYSTSDQHLQRNLRKYPPDFLDICLRSKRPLSMINQAISECISGNC